MILNYLITMIANSGQPPKRVTYARIAILDKSTICSNSSKDTYNLVAFPYDCQKFVECSPSKEFITVRSVAENLVYNPANGQATNPSQLTCAVRKGKSSFIMIKIIFKMYEHTYVN